MGGVEVADVEGAGAVVGELMRGRAADAEGGVGAGYDDDFVFDAPGTCEQDGWVSATGLFSLIMIVATDW